MPRWPTIPGLCVDALDGAPGIYSARWAGPTKDFRIAMARVDDELRHKGLPPSCPPNSSARWRWRMPHGETQTFEGEVHGHLVLPAARRSWLRL